MEKYIIWSCLGLLLLLSSVVVGMLMSLIKSHKKCTKINTEIKHEQFRINERLDHLYEISVNMLTNRHRN